MPIFPLRRTSLFARRRRRVVQPAVGMERLESRALLALMDFTIQDNSGLDPTKYAIYAMGSNFTASADTNWYMDSSLKFTHGPYGTAPDYTTPSFKVSPGQKISVPDDPGLAGVRLYFFVVPVGGVAGATVIDASFGYTGSEVPVTFSAPPVGGVAAQGFAQLVASDDPGLNLNKVGSIVVTNPGSGYTSAPTITIAPPGVVDTVTVTSGGSGYPDGSQSFLVTNQPNTADASVHVSVSGGAVQAAGVQITNRGSGYTPLSSLEQPIAISPGSGGQASITLKSAATASATLFGNQGPSLPFGTEPANPPGFPFVSQFVEFTVTAKANTVDLQTVDGFTLPMTITAGKTNVNVAGKQYGQPIATPQQPGNAVVTRAAIFDAFTAFMTKQGTAGQPYASLPYTLDSGLVDGQQGGILSPGLFLAATNTAGDYVNLTSPLNTVFENDLSTLFHSATKLSVQGVPSGDINAQVYAVTYKSIATYPSPVGVTLKSGTGESITHSALEFKGTSNTFQMFNPTGLSAVDSGLTGTISGVSGAYPHQTATLSLNNPLPDDAMKGVVQKGWFVNGSGLFQGPGANQSAAISPWYVQEISDNRKTVTLAYTDVNGSVPGTANTTTTASQFQFSKLPYIAMMQTPGQMAFGNSGVFADNTLQYFKDSSKATVLGDLEYQVAAALNRGVLFAKGAQGATGGGTSTVWFNESGWYPLGVNQNIFAQFMHVAQVGGVPIFFQPKNAVQIQGQSGPKMGSAYGFPFDETPPGGSQVPSKFDGNIGGSAAGALPTDILVTFGPWGNAAAPTIVSIDTNPPQQGTTPTPTTSQSVTWTVAFTQPVTGVTAANFSLVSGIGLSGTSITSVTPSGSGQYSQTWTVTANSGSGTGLLGLNMTSAAGVSDAKGHQLTLTGGSFTGQVYSVRPNPVGPTASIALAGTNPTNASTVPFTVTFTEAVTGLTAANFAAVQGGSVNGAFVQSLSSVSGTTWTVIVNTGTGSGTLALTLATSTGITPVPTGLPVTSSPYTIDKNDPTNPPDVSSIALADANPTAASSVSWTVSFTEPVTGLTAANFQLVVGGLGGTPAITGVTPASGTNTATWTVTASTGSGSGTLGLNMTNSTNVHDADSQAVTNVPFTGSIYAIDRTAPALESITRADASPTALTVVSWTVTFSEAVSGVSKSNFQLVASGLSGAQLTQVSQTGGSAAVWTVTALTGSGNGTLQLKMINSTGVTDAVGLAPTGIPLAGQTYQIQRGGATIVSAPISFMTTAGAAARLVWLLVPFADRDSVRLAAALTVSPASGGTLRATSRAGVTVTPSGTPSAELQFSGTVAALNAYFMNKAGFISYTPIAGSFTPRTLTLSAQGSDGLSGLATAAVLVRSAAPQAPAPAVRPTAFLGTSPVGQPVVISYAQLVAATGATQTTSRSIQFMLAGLSSGRLEIWTGSRWSVVPAVANIPLLAPGGQLRWTPPTGASVVRAAFAVKAWDGWRMSGISRVSVHLTR